MHSWGKSSLALFLKCFLCTNLDLQRFQICCLLAGVAYPVFEQLRNEVILSHKANGMAVFLAIIWNNACQMGRSVL